MVGRTISHYKIVAKLGEGGMGEVYRAEDTSLGRPVALKFLASHLLNDAEAKQRFLREAKAAAAIRHPNICTVFEVAAEGDQTFLAMDYVEGESLEDRIAKGPLPLKDALEIGRQIAEGLKAAHAKGIVHRDIKPANVMVDDEGRATILDFGLARLTEASKLTKPDQTVGTVAYMSPEQIQGAEIDHRTDIWALGCTLYEMVAGVRPFQGQYDQALAYEIVNQDPEPLTAVRTGVPMDLEFIVGKCLAKEAEDRYSSSHELATDLRTLSEKLKSGRSTILKTSPTGAAAAIMAGARTRNSAATLAPDAVVVGKRKLQALYSLAGLLAVALLALSFVHLTETLPPSPVRSFSFAPNDYAPGTAVISPDGKSILYQAGTGSGSSLWLHSLSNEATRELAGTEGALGFSFWSADSLSIGFAVGDELKRVSINGGNAITLCELPDNGTYSFVGGAFSFDGQTIVFSSGLRLWEIPARGGQPELLFDPGDSHRPFAGFPHFLPTSRGSHGLAYVAAVSPEDQMLAVMDLDSGERRELGPGTRPFYSAEGYLIHGPMNGNDRGLQALPFSLDKLEATGPSFRIDDTGTAASTSLDGTLVYTDRPSGSGLRQLVVRDRAGNRQTVGDPIEGAKTPAVSPDGGAIALEIAGDVWTYDLDRDVRTRLTTSEDAIEHLVFWPSSSAELTYASQAGAGLDDRVMTQVADGSVPAQELLETVRLLSSLDWSPDGRSLIYNGNPGPGAPEGTIGGIAYRDQGADGSWSEEQLFVSTPFAEQLPQFSPDGRFVAYNWDPSGRPEIYVRPFPPAPGQWQVSRNGGRQPRWSADGRELFYVQEQQDALSALMAIPVSTQPEFVVGQPKRLFTSTGLTLDRYEFGYDAFADGQRFVMLELLEDVGEESQQQTIRLVQNWAEEFRDREDD